MKPEDFSKNVLDHFVDDTPIVVSSVKSIQVGPDDRVYLAASGGAGYLAYESDYVAPGEMPWIKRVISETGAEFGYAVVELLRPSEERWTDLPFVFSPREGEGSYVVARIRTAGDPGSAAKQP
jgi:hypothetical protein